MPQPTTLAKHYSSPELANQLLKRVKKIIKKKMPSEKDVARKPISGWDWVGWKSLGYVGVGDVHRLHDVFHFFKH